MTSVSTTSKHLQTGALGTEGPIQGYPGCFKPVQTTSKHSCFQVAKHNWTFKLASQIRFSLDQGNKTSQKSARSYSNGTGTST